MCIALCACVSRSVFGTSSFLDQCLESASFSTSVSNQLLSRSVSRIRFCRSLAVSRIRFCRLLSRISFCRSVSQISFSASSFGMHRAPICVDLRVLPSVVIKWCAQERMANETFQVPTRHTRIWVKELPNLLSPLVGLRCQA